MVMPYDTNIPGQISEFELRAIEVLATAIPPGATMVETGSLFGRSSYAWAKSVDPSVEVVCIDPFAGNRGIKNIEDRLGITYGIDAFKRFTADCQNIRTIQGFSPQVVEHYWKDEIFLYFDDSVHANPGFARNLRFWSDKVVKGGILCGDDYRPRFPDIRNEVNRYCDVNELKLFVVDFMWIALDPGAPVYDAVLLETKLLELADEAETARAPFSGVRVEGVRIVDAPKKGWSRVELDVCNMSKSDICVTCSVPEAAQLVGEREAVLPFDEKFMSCFSIEVKGSPGGVVTLIATGSNGEQREKHVDLAAIVAAQGA